MQVWHEKWGEDYSKEGDACGKYTDRWSETRLDDGRYVKGGDKWREDFGSGRGAKTGETWHEHADGSRRAPLLFFRALAFSPGQTPSVFASEMRQVTMLR